VSTLVTSLRLTCWLTEEHARWITPHPPWAPLDEEGNDVPVYVAVSIVSRGLISVINSFRISQMTAVTRSPSLNEVAQDTTQWETTHHFQIPVCVFNLLVNFYAGLFVLYTSNVFRTDLQLVLNVTMYHSEIQTSCACLSMRTEPGTNLNRRRRTLKIVEEYFRSSSQRSGGKKSSLCKVDVD
jgi:hypothetical protein